MPAEKMIPLSPLPPAPQQKVDSPEAFSTKAEAFVTAQVKLATEINTGIVPAHNSLVEPVNKVIIHLPTILAAPGKALQATASAQEAATSAAAALVSEKAAAASEKQAKASEKTAVASEKVAVDKAAEARASATAAATSEVNATSHSHPASEISEVIPVTKGGTGNTAGNAATATRLQTARTISITGDATGSTSFNGAGNVNISVTLKTGAAPSNGMVFYAAAGYPAAPTVVK